MEKFKTKEEAKAFVYDCVAQIEQINAMVRDANNFINKPEKVEGEEAIEKPNK